MFSEVSWTALPETESKLIATYKNNRLVSIDTSRPGFSLTKARRPTATKECSMALSESDLSLLALR